MGFEVRAEVRVRVSLAIEPHAGARGTALACWLDRHENTSEAETIVLRPCVIKNSGFMVIRSTVISPPLVVSCGSAN